MSSVVLASGGLDSIVNLYEAVKSTGVKLALTFNYGQRAAQREAAAAAWHCKKLNVPHKILDVTWFRDFTNTSLVNRDKDVPVNMKLEDEQALEMTAEAVWVPNRNGIMLNIAAGYAEGLGGSWVVPGFNREEALTFPDNSESFIESMNKSLYFSTNARVRVKCFTSGMNKVEIMARAVELGVDLNWLWPCYNDGDTICGECESCLRFRRAYKIYTGQEA
ncbi:MAG TPA: 7-cyano-7-deazaguanine synthase QueC [Bdellovibrionales bacterium]|nr:7-cyano-7-deazaguanine synthase QueC [Bdellovibrionales bacterium]